MKTFTDFINSTLRTDRPAYLHDDQLKPLDGLHVPHDDLPENADEAKTENFLKVFSLLHSGHLTLLSDDCRSSSNSWLQSAHVNS
jgi:hypothetical protein